MKAPTKEAPARKFTPIRGLLWVAMMLFCLNAVLDSMVFHGIASSSVRKAGQPINWAVTPYTSVRALSYERKVKYAKLSTSNWYLKDFSISKSGLYRSRRESNEAIEKVVNRFIKP